MYVGRTWRYVYVWSDRITRQLKYTGQHTTGLIEDGYIGSGVKLTEVYKNLGEVEFHKRYKHDIIQFYPDKDSLNQGEIDWIAKNKTLYTYGGWNLTIGGDGGFDYINENKLHPQYNNKTLWSEIQKKKWTNVDLPQQKEEYEIHGTKNFYYWHTPEGHKERSKLGVNAVKKLFPQGIWKNKIHKQSSKDLIGAKSRIHQKGSGNSQFGSIWITNGYQNKKIQKDSIIPPGFRRGRVMSTLSSVG